MTRARPATFPGAAVPLLLFAFALTVLGIVPPASADPAAAPELTVRISSLSPSVIPKHGPITIRGVITNTSKQTWTNLSAYPLTSTYPLTTAADVDDAARTDPATTYLGQRLFSARSNVGDLYSGTSVHFRLRVPRKSLLISGGAGVYWIGVQVVGTDATGTTTVGGQARTFIPLVTGRGQANLSLVIPIRQEVRRATNGSILNPTHFAHELAPTGRLGQIAAFGEAAGAIPITWLVDPAVLDAAQDIADGNPALDLGPAGAPGTASPTASPSSTTPAGGPAPGLTDVDRSNAHAWLQQITALLKVGPTLALPYADPDVSAVERTAPTLLTRARAMSTAAMSTRQISAAPAIAPVDGYLDPAALPAVPAGATALLGDHGVHRATHLIDGRRIVYASTLTASGGPLPAPRLRSLGLRQRILSDAALQAIDHRNSSIVVTLPADWAPGQQLPAFFAGLSQPWLSIGSIPSGTLASRAPMTYPDSARKGEIGAANIARANGLLRTATILGQLLVSPKATGSDHDIPGPEAGATDPDVLTGAALATVSYGARRQPVRFRVAAFNLDRAVGSLLTGITVAGTNFVTLSGGSGTLTVAAVNGLNQPVTISLRARTGTRRIRIDSPQRIRLSAGQRSTIRLTAHADVVGVHQIQLIPETVDGARVGTPLLFSLRTSQVGKVFWVILILGGVLVFAMVLRRITQRIRSHRWRQ